MVTDTTNASFYRHSWVVIDEWNVYYRMLDLMRLPLTTHDIVVEVVKEESKRYWSRSLTDKATTF